MKQSLYQVGLAVLSIALIISYGTRNIGHECPKEPYKQNQMVGGCVMQKSGDNWIRTCG
ncbi:hypothetical protein UFOVP1640_59 [uncultured Caudovirales phage]|uniref:Uncharacterized protein n=1 Tax=uncultured Caudovirales phage TaxID=2100421 RepID=A0A6J5T1V7_9CAUD|nr:hypothetical protein UFOVP1286_62 [uncultured Caudovirales phage]CAB4205603.1 hypothetical protein UFOVP1407_92 [uncultured Caudovirales phage]CAB4221658.1 hypothetical protein UFOVP1640_59 [uncultured Caudovirales phage]